MIAETGEAENHRDPPPEEESRKERRAGKRRERETHDHPDEEGEREKRGDRKGDLFLTETKRRKSTDADGEESSSFSFSIDAASFSPTSTINTTPKFGSFNCFAVKDGSISVEGEETGGGDKLVHGQEGDSAALSQEVEL